MSCHLRLVACTLAVVTTVSGCAHPLAGWIDPLVAADRAESAPTTIDAAIDYTNRAKDELYAAMSNQARLATLSGTVLIPLATVGAGLAVFGKTVSATYVGLAGTGTYLTANWLRNQPAQLAYVGGYEAVNCIASTVAPFASVDRLQAGTTSSRTKLEDGLARIDELLPDARQAAVRLEAAAGTANSALQVQIKTALAEAETLIREAGIAREGGRRLQATVASLPQQVVVAVDRVQGEVNRAVINSLPDLAALSGIVSSVGSVYGRFGQVPTSQEPSPLETSVQPDSKRSGEQELSELVEILEKLAPAQAEVAATLNAVAEQKPVEAMAACGVPAELLAPPLTLVPPGPYTLTDGQAGSLGFVATGGRSPYSAVVASATRDVIVRPVDLAGAFVIETTADAPVSTYPILVREAGGQVLPVELEIEPAVSNDEGGGPGPDRENGAPEPTCRPVLGTPQNHCLMRSDIVRLQNAVCMPARLQDGVWGPVSRRYFIDLQARSPAELGVTTPALEMTEATKDLLLGLGDARIAELCGDKQLRDDLGSLAAGLPSVVEVGGAQFWRGEAVGDAGAAAVTIELCKRGEPDVATTVEQVRSRFFEDAAERIGDAEERLTAASIAIVGADRKTVTDLVGVPACDEPE